MIAKIGLVIFVLFFCLLANEALKWTHLLFLPLSGLLPSI